MACGAIGARLTLAAVFCFGTPVWAATSAQSVAEAAPWVKPAIDGVFDLFRHKPVVALGDAHGVAQEEAFYSALVRDPRFAEEVGNVVVEFGGEASQDIIDRYVAGEDVPLKELRRVWTETVGWIPGATSLGYVNFYANVRAANLKLPRERRIKVWLGDPKVDWSKINSMEDITPLLGQRDDNFFRILSDEILKKQKKTLLIIGTGHLVALDLPGGPRALGNMLAQAYPGALALVSPFVGYVEPECNAKVVARAKDWPVPALVGPVEGTWLMSELDLPGCNYPVSVIFLGRKTKKPEKGKAAIGPAPGVQRLGPDQAPCPDEKTSKSMVVESPPPAVEQSGRAELPSEDELLKAEKRIYSGTSSDAILYLGPPDSLIASPIDPDIYLDPDYFKEESRRLKCCAPFGETLDWDQLLRENPVVPRKFEIPH
jgi:hypothetical protein